MSVIVVAGAVYGRPFEAAFGSSHALIGKYETRLQHDPDGTGNFYLGREIAQVMGPGGIELLNQDQRENEEHPTQVLLEAVMDFASE